MSVIRIASRYAKSLLDLALEENKLQRVLEDIQVFKKASTNRDLYLCIKSPIINATKKRQIFEALFADEFDTMTMSFLRIILSKGREAYLPEIADEFINQYRAYKGISTVQLTTAAPLKEDAIERIRKKLQESSQTSSTIEITTKVDPGIIGGFVIEFDDKLYDASVAYKLKQLKKEFTRNDYLRSV